MPLHRPSAQATTSTRPVHGFASSVAYADPYLSGRAPEFPLFNAGIQQALTNSITLTLNYAGTQSHFVVTGASNPRGYWANQLDPKYLVALAGVG